MQRRNGEKNREKSSNRNHWTTTVIAPGRSERRPGDRGSVRGAVVVAGAMLLSCLVPPCAEGHLDVDSMERDRVAFGSSPEAWAMKYFAGVTLFSGFGPPESTSPGAFRFAFEVADIPQLDRRERRVGLDGTKEEDTNKAPLVLRPRLTIGLTEKLSATVSYVPPVRVFDARTRLAAVSLNRPLIETGSFTAGVRAIAQYANVEADIVCPKDKLGEGDFEDCHEPSNDTVRMDTYGVELGASWRISRLRDLAPYVTVSYQTMKMEFQVDAILNDGTVHDQDVVYTSGQTWAFGTGLTYPLSDRLKLSAGVVYMPNHVRRRDEDGQPKSRRNEPMVNARFQVSYDF